jgi:hypothetical protein
VLIYFAGRLLNVIKQFVEVFVVEQCSIRQVVHDKDWQGQVLLRKSLVPKRENDFLGSVNSAKHKLLERKVWAFPILAFFV